MFVHKQLFIILSIEPNTRIPWAMPKHTHTQKYLKTDKSHNPPVGWLIPGVGAVLEGLRQDEGRRYYG